MSILGRAIWPLGVILCLTAPHLAPANEYILAATGSVGIPTGEMKAFTDQTSFRGGTLDLRNLRWNSFSWGVYAGLNALRSRSNDPTTIAGVTMGGGDQYRWVNTIPVYLTGHWYPVRSTNGLTVFLGGGIGGIRALRRVDVVWFRKQEDSWHLGGAPEIGVLIPLSLEFKLMARMQYHYAVDSGDHWGPRYLSLGFGLAEY